MIHHLQNGGIGKRASLKKFKTSQHFQAQARVFDTKSASSEENIAAGEQALVALCNGKPGKNGFAVLQVVFKEVFISISFISPQAMPLTLLLQNTTASEFTSKYWTGKDVLRKLVH